MIRLAPRIPRAGPIPLFLLGAAGLALLSAALWPVDAGAPLAEPGAPPLDLARLAAADSGVALSRPLFDPERRPWTARGSREDLTASERPPTLLSVRGILIEDRVRRALVADGTTEPAWLAPGEGRGAWRLVSIAPSEVVVADANRQYTLAFLGTPVPLRPAPRHPVPKTPTRERTAPETSPEAPALRSALEPPEASPPVRQISIGPPDRN